MKIVLRLTDARGISETVVVESGQDFRIPSGDNVEVLSLQGVKDMTVEGGVLVLSGAGGDIHIAGLGQEFLVATALSKQIGIDAPLPPGFARFLEWSDQNDLGQGEERRVSTQNDYLPNGDQQSSNVPYTETSEHHLLPNSQSTPVSAPQLIGFSEDTGAKGDGITADNTLVLTGHGDEGVQVYIHDGATLMGSATVDPSGNWSFTTPTLGDGVHDFTATVSNGETSATSPELTVTVDTLAPAAPVIDGFSDDTGAAGDNITADNTPHLTGTAEAGSTVSIFDGTTLLGTVTASESGVWSFTTSALADGSHAFSAKATDAAGNESQASAAFDVLIDSTAPVSPVITGFESDSGVADSVTSDNTPTLAGTAEAYATVVIHDGATTLGSVTADAVGHWSYTTGALADGTHEFTATAQDAAGNTGAASSALSVTVDTVAPGVTLTSPVSGDDLIGGTEAASVGLSGTAEGADTVSITFRDGGGGTLTETAHVTSGGNWSISGVDLSSLQDGPVRIEVQSTDTAGNVSDVASGTVTLDTAPPQAPVIEGFSDDTGVAGDGITSDNTLTLTGSAEANATVKLFDGTTLLGTTTASGAGDWSFTTAPLSDGTHALAASAVDEAGNESGLSSTENVIIDTEAPGLTVTTPISGDGLVNAVEALNLSISGTATGGQLVHVTFSDGHGGTATGAAAIDGAGNWTLAGVDISALQDGAVTIEAYSIDNAGSRSATVSRVVTLDSVAPVAPILTGYSEDTGLQGDGVTSDTTPTLNGTGEAGATVEVFDGVNSLGTTTVDGAGNWTFQTAALGEGSHSLTAFETDEAGNRSAPSGTLNLTVDTTAPTVAIATPVSGDGVVNGSEDNALSLSGTSSGAQSVLITFSDGTGASVTETAIVNGVGAWSITGVDISSLANGAIDVKAEARDQAGNLSTPATTTITLDNVAPAAPAISGVADDTGSSASDGYTADNTITFSGTADAGTTVNVYRGVTVVATGVADGTGHWTATSSVQPDGYASFNARAVDAAGNLSAASSPVILYIDTTAPTVPVISGFGDDTGVAGDNVTADNTLTLNGTADVGSTIVVYDNGSEIGTAVVSGGNWSFTTAQLADGSHSLTAVARDNAGNVSASSSTLDVTVDTTAPGAPVISGFADDSGVTGDNVTNDTSLTLSGTAEAHSSVEVFDGNTSLGTIVADGSGNWSFDATGLGDGLHNFKARATDEQGNRGGFSSTLDVTIDTEAPAAPTISGFSDDTGTPGDGVTGDATLTLSGHAEAGSTVHVYDGATLLGDATVQSNGDWSYTTSTLPDGAHAFTATATDAAGNTGNASTALDVTIQTGPTAVPTITSLSTDTGVVGDGITSDTSPLIGGTAEALATVKVYDGATLLGTVTADGAGSWSYQANALSEGVHNITATATGGSGTTSAPSSAYELTIDTTAPDAPVIDGFADDTGIADGQTSDNTLTFNGTAEAGATVNVYVGGNVVATGVADGTGHWSATSGPLADGYTSFSARATDEAGNTSVPSSPVIAIIDTTPPAAPSISGYTSDSGVPGDDITNVATLSLNGTAPLDAREVAIYDGGVRIGTASSGGGVWSFTTGTLADGDHQLTVAALDAAGNEGAKSSALNVTIDTTAPAAPTITGFADDTGTTGDGITGDATLTISGTAEANAVVTVRDGGTVLGTAQADGNGDWSFDTAALSQGAHSFTAVASDVAGNNSPESTPLGVTVQLEQTAAPVITGFSDNTGYAGDHLTSDTTPTLSGTAVAGASVSILLNAAVVGTVAADSNGDWSYTSSALAEGNYSFTAAATANGQAQSAASNQMTLTIDTTPPAVTIASPVSGDDLVNHTEGGNLTFSGTATGGQSVALTFTDSLGGTVTANATVLGNGSWTATQIDLSALQDGNVTVSAVATDQAGNSSAPVTHDITLDTVAPAAPVMTGFDDNTGYSSSSTSDNTPTFHGTAEAGATVNVYAGGNIVATGVADGNGDWSATAGPLGDGYTSFNARAVDEAGNRSDLSGSLIVVIDTQAPSTPAISGYSNDSGTVGDGITNDSTITLTGTADAGSRITVYDNGVSLGTAVFTSATGWTFTSSSLADGDHSFTAVASDGAGNASSQSSSLDITIDTTRPDAPVISGFTEDTGNAGDGQTYDNTPTFHGTAEAGSTVHIYNGITIVATGVADGNGDWTATAAPMADGYYYLYARAVDEAGNTSGQGTTAILNIDTFAPAAPEITGYTNDTGTPGDAISNYNWTTLSGTAAAGTNSIAIYDNGVQIGTAHNNGGTWTYTASALSEGDHSFTAIALDYVGNQSAVSTAQDFTVDRTLPAAPVISGFSDDTGVVGDGRTADSTVTLTGTSEANATVRVYENGTSIGTAVADGSGNWSFTTSALSEGMHNFTARATDVAGNTGSQSPTTFIAVDLTDPTGTTITGFSDDSGAQGDGITNDTTPTLTGQAEAASTVEIFDGGVSLGTTTADNSGNWTFTTAALGDGDHNFTAEATDRVGRTSAPSSVYTIGIDTTPPSATDTPAITAFSQDTGATGDHLTSDTSLLIAGTSVAGALIEVFDGGVSLGTTTANGAGSWTYQTTGLAEGSHDFTATATASGSGESAASSALTVTVDTTPPPAPVIAGFSDDTGAADGQTSDNTLTFTGTADAGSTVNVYSGATIVATGVADGNGDWSATTGTLADGYTSFFARAVDAAGNGSAPSDSTVIIIDTTPPPVPEVTGYASSTVSGTAEAGTQTVLVYDNGTLLGTVYVANGNWSYTLTGDVSGDHSFTASGKDYVGNESAQSSAYDVNVDVTPPAAPVIAGISEDTGVSSTDLQTSDNTPTIFGTAEANTTVHIYAGGAELGTAAVDGNGDWSFDSQALSDGYQYITAKAEDASGNIGPASSTSYVLIDTVAPAAPTIDTPVSGDNMVNSTDDGYLSLSGTATAGSTVEVTFSDAGGGSITRTAIVSGTSWWLNGSDISSLQNGTITVQAVAADRAGNTSAVASQTFTLDNVAPATPVVTGLSDDTGTIARNTSDTTPTFSGTADAGSHISILSGATVIATAVADSGGDWSATVSSALSDGFYSLNVRAEDDAGNRSSSIGTYVTIDTTPPAAPVISGYLNGNGTAGDGLTNDYTITLQGTRPSATTITVYDNGTAIGTVPMTGTSWSYSVSSLSEGTHNFTVVANDGAGNVSDPTGALSVNVDHTPPASPVITGYQEDGGTTGGSTTADNTPTIIGTATAGTTINVYNGASIVGTGTTDSHGDWAVTLNTLSDGSYYLSARSEDTAGNSSGQSNAIVFSIDTSITTSSFSLLSLTSDAGTMHETHVSYADPSVTPAGPIDGQAGHFQADTSEDHILSFDKSWLTGGDAAGTDLSSVTATSQHGADISFDASSGTVTYNPQDAGQIQALGQGERLDDSFTYTLSDGSTGTMTLELKGVDGYVAAHAGTAADETFTIGNSTIDHVDGGAGTDTLLLATSSLDLTKSGDSAIHSVERVDMGQGGGHSVTLEARDVLNMSSDLFDSGNGEHTRVTILGQAGDSVTTTDPGWTFEGTATEHGVTYNVFDNGPAQLFVQDSVAHDGTLSSVA